MGHASEGDQDLETQSNSHRSNNFDVKYIEMEHCYWLEECKLVFESVAITAKSANSIEKVTREQSNSKAWFKYKAE